MFTFIHVAGVVLLLAATASSAPQREIRPPVLLEVQEKPHVAILKYINQMSQDGSYTYGFEAADGSFRVETRDPQGFVKGKYGYLDENGEVKTVDYVAGKPGFNPKGHHLPSPNGPLLPSSKGNVDDEFGTDEDWESVDADEDGMPDPPRPASQRNQPPRPVLVAARPAPSVVPFQQPIFVPAAGPQRFAPIPPGFQRIPPA